MKKFFLCAAIGVAGLMSASTDIEVKDLDSKNVETKKTKVVDIKDVESEANLTATSTCITYGMIFPCDEETVYSDTICYGEGTDTPTVKDFFNCMNQNYALLSESICG